MEMSPDEVQRLQTLLDKIGVLNLQYEKLKDKDKFNIFSILRGSHDEVPLHSRFIFELLNPEGTHKEGDQFLRLFLQILGNQNFEMDGVEVHREHQNIDILISNKKQAIIIENKIWAKDQENQLERYYEQIKKQKDEEVWLVYLTLHGNEPSEDSLGDLKKKIKEKFLVLISYSEHILAWLEKCVEKSARNPLLREAIIQYENLVKEITGKTMSDEHGREVYDLLGEKENIHSAKTIVLNWNHVRWYLEWDFWTGFESIIKEEYKVLEIQKYTDPALSSVIHRNKRNKSWYGIMFELFSKSEDKFCLFIERGTGSLHYGITIVSNEKRGSKEKHDEYAEFTTKLEDFTRWNRKKLPPQGDAWLGGKYFKQGINFAGETEDTLALIDENHRKECLKGMWKEIKEFITAVEKVKAEVLDKN